MVWSLTRLELTSAVERRAREGKLRRSDRTKALARIERLSESAHEVLDVLAVRSRAAAILARQALRAADAAEAEGFPVLTWPDAR